ncbi:NAD(P)/FAD-dependent oxidoreductase [Flavobacterium sp. NRK1]|uniref:NAD(P)/FAD-dependent oxidoreductase n=1 Tax=Flavobacterium sp. NRK1 TaxID=2954929 RepID=UPI002092314C|nr:NAD(P)/FAD-dependent oxidoreductase [Flavobacterium sp. NRK1]MCO6146640.1 NAD(P)/FAD-dependent oxidoreductase [Flavobacterium sp. NRK1]
MNYEVIIIGGSYSGLSAAMALGRASRNVLIIDSGEPCNKQTPHSHNFITQDGEKPAVISSKAKEQVMRYPTVSFENDKAVKAVKTDKGFEITTESGAAYTAKKLLLATGVKDIMPAIHGFAECWGISIIHCPYCHGYEVKNQKTALMASGDIALHMIPMLLQWTKDLTLFTNGEAIFTNEQLAKFKQHNVAVIETEIESVQHTNGKLNSITLKNGDIHDFSVMYAKIKTVQHTFIPEDLGCIINDQGLIEVDEFKKTNIPSVFASGDCTTQGRAVAMAVEAGTKAGVMINMELCIEAY